MASELWPDKYAPKNFSEFIGNSEIVEHVSKWADAWGKGRQQKPLLLYGQTGSGKTELALLIARLKDWDIFELNASDFRTKDIIEKIAGGAAQNASFSGKLRLVLIDEIDGIQGNADRGGLSAVSALLKDARNPVIITANDLYAKQGLSTLKFVCEAFEFKKINYLSIAKRLKEIADLEKVDYDPEAVKELAKNSSGDFRSCLLDLQTLSMQKSKIAIDDLKSLGFRERQEKIFKVLMDIFKGKTMQEIRFARDSAEVDNDLLEKWIEENIPRHFTDIADMAAAFERLSRADIYNGRIMRRQHWGFLRYSMELMTSGVALSRENDYHGYIAYQFPTLLSKLSKSKSVRALKKEMAKKIAQKTHSTSRKVISQDLVYLQQMFANPQNAIDFTAYLDLNEDEVAFLLGTKPETKKVQKIISDADELRKTLMIEHRKHSALFQHAEPETEEKLVPGKNQTRLF